MKRTALSFLVVIFLLLCIGCASLFDSTAGKTVEEESRGRMDEMFSGSPDEIPDPLESVEKESFPEVSDKDPE